MKKTVLAMALMAISTSVIAAPELKVGETYYIQRLPSGADLVIKEDTPDWNFKNAYWVKISKPIADKKPGDTCFFVDGAKVKYLGKHPTFGLLVNYIHGETTKESCPNGSVAFVDPIKTDTFKSEPTKETPENLEKAADKLLKSRNK